jgi:electron transport complex protein RnfG
MLNSLKMGVILAVFCVLAAWGLAYVYQFTQPQIEKNAAQTIAEAKRSVLPVSGAGVVRQVAVRGYAGEIKLLVGIDEKGRISGVKVLSQQETPGLGANIVKTDWLKQFQGKTAADKLEAKQDIDAVTGATISSRAVCSGVRQAVRQAMGGDK